MVKIFPKSTFIRKEILIPGVRYVVYDTAVLKLYVLLRSKNRQRKKKKENKKVWVSLSRKKRQTTAIFTPE